MIMQAFDRQESSMVGSYAWCCVGRLLGSYDDPLDAGVPCQECPARCDPPNVSCKMFHLLPLPVLLIGVQVTNFLDEQSNDELEACVISEVGGKGGQLAMYAQDANA